MKKENTPPNIHIGSIIRAIAAERGISETELAAMINCHISTAHYIYEKENINTERLWQISIALNYDFFTEIYGVSLAPIIKNPLNNTTVNIMVSSDKITVEKKNGITLITEYRKNSE
jgi:transcriptional regulator with XRE-family HTH domain